MTFKSNGVRKLIRARSSESLNERFQTPLCGDKHRRSDVCSVARAVAGLEAAAFNKTDKWIQLRWFLGKTRSPTWLDGVLRRNILYSPPLFQTLLTFLVHNALAALCSKN